MEKDKIQFRGNLELDSSSMKYKIDQAIEMTYGDNKYYQKRTILLFSIQFFILAIFQLSPPLLFMKPIFEYKVSESSDQYTSKQYDEDTGACDINSIKISQNSIHSITYQYKLYCSQNNQMLNTLGQSLIYFGIFLGLITSNQIADNKGRKFVIQIKWFLGTISGLFILFADNLTMTYIGLFCLGILLTPVGIILQVYLSEICVGNLRQTSILALYVAWGLSQIAFWPLTLITTNWQQFIIFFVLIPATLFNIIPLTIFESPKYLYLKDKEKSVEVLNAISKSNGSPHTFTVEQIQDTEILTQLNKTYHIFDLYKYKSIRTTAILIQLFAFLLHIQYYGINFVMVNIGMSMEQNYFIFGIFETLGYLISSQTCTIMKRKKCVQINIILMSAFLLTTYFIPIPCSKNIYSSDTSCWQKYIQSVLVGLYRFVSCFTFSIIILWCNELFPTSIRSISLSTMMGCGLFGSFLSPYFLHLFSFVGCDNLVMLSLLGVFGFLVIIPLNETLGCVSKEDIEELKQNQNINVSLNANTPENEDHINNNIKEQMTFRMNNDNKKVEYNVFDIIKDNNTKIAELEINKL